MPPPVDLAKIEDDSYLASILKRKRRSLSESVPQDIDPREALANIRSLVESLNTLGKATSLRGAILGAYMTLLVKRPDIYEAAGYDSLREFEKAEIVDKVSHGSCWNYKLIGETFPEATIERVLEIGSTNMLKAAKVCKSIGATPKQREVFLEKAAELNCGQFTEWVEKRSGVSEPGGTTTDSYPLIGSAAQVKELKEWLADERFIEFAGVSTPLGMVLAAIEEASSVFPKIEEPLQVGAVKSETW